MRELKFRAWDKDANRMAYSENEDDYWWEINPFRCGYIAGESGGDQFEPPSPIPGYCDNVMQFTGLQDKNGKDIYEGDIIKVPSSWNTYGMHAGEVYEIYFAHGGFRMKPKYGEKSKGFWLEDDGVFKIIGNIYKNQKLLNQNK